MVISSTNNTNSYIGLYIFLGISILALFLVIFLAVFNKKRNDKVKQLSTYLKEIENINNKYVFYTFSRSMDTKVYHLNSKRSFDNFDYYKREKEYIKENLSYYKKLIEQISFNSSLLIKYKEEISLVKATSDENLIKSSKMSAKSFRKREKKIGDKLIKHPLITYTLRIKWEYTSPAGRNHYSDFFEFLFSDIKSTVCQLATDNYTIKYGNYQSQQKRIQKQNESGKVYTNDDIEDVID